MTTPQDVPPQALARDIWKYEPWARTEAMRHFWVKMVWMSVAILATMLLLPLIRFAPSSLAFAVAIGAFAGGGATMFGPVVGEYLRERDQKAFIAHQLAQGIDPKQVRGIPDIPGRMSFPARLFLANAIAFFRDRRNRLLRGLGVHRLLSWLRCPRQHGRRYSPHNSQRQIEWTKIHN